MAEVLRKLLDSDDEEKDHSSDDDDDILSVSSDNEDNNNQRGVNRVMHIDIDIGLSESGESSLSTATLSSRNDTSSSVSSLMSVLKAPKLSNLSRKQAVLRNPPCGKRRCQGSSVHDPTNIKPMQRVNEYPNEALTVSNNFAVVVVKNYA